MTRTLNNFFSLILKKNIETNCKLLKKGKKKTKFYKQIKSQFFVKDQPSKFSKISSLLQK